MTTTDPTTDLEAWDPDACAAAGAALLDTTWPGWRDQLDPDRLDMADGSYRGEPTCRACVGAQLHYHHQVARRLDPGEAEGDYAMFLFGLAPSVGDAERYAWQVAHGFIIPDDFVIVTTAEETAAYEALTAAWRRLLAGSTP